MIRLITCSILCIWALTGCGGGGGGGSAAAAKDNSFNGQTANQLFRYDMTWLRSSQLSAAKATDAQMNGALTKAFGGDQPDDIHRFISERVKHVYSYDEMKKFMITIDYGPGSDSQSVGDIFGFNDDDVTNGEVFMRGFNISTSLAVYHKQTQYDISIALPSGNVPITSPRVGLVGLTKYYYAVPDETGVPQPLLPESRISVLIHEGRHSDCPQGIDSYDCGFAHSICQTGPAAGQAACESGNWGAYAVGAIYLKATLKNYGSNSLNHMILQSMIDDNLSRLTRSQIEALSTTDPLHGAF